MKEIITQIRNFYFPVDIYDHLRVKISVVRMFFTFFVCLVFLSGVIFIPAPKTKAMTAVESVTLDETLSFSFSRPIKRNEIQMNISPSVEGQWKWERPIFGSKHLFTKLVFIPSDLYQPETTYSVKVSGIQNIAPVVDKKDFDFTFKTQGIPKLASVSPAKDLQDVKLDSQIELSLDQKNTNLVEFEVESEPKVDFEITLNEDKTKYVFKPKTNFSQGTQYQLKIYRTVIIFDAKQNKVLKRDERELVYEGSFKVQNAPGLNSFSPSGDHVLITNSNIRIEFSQPMDRVSVEQNTTFSPSLEGKFEWESDTVLNYRLAKALNYATYYGLKIKSGTKNLTGGFVTEDINQGFKTIGNAYVTSVYPSNGVGGVKAGTNISVSFDQAVDHASAESHFSISDGRKGVFTWSGNTMTFNPNEDLAKDSGYTVAMSAGVKSLYGLDSVKGASSTFYTEQTFVKLGVPMDYQDYPLSCEVASLKMALAYKGVYVSEDTLMGYVGYDPTPHVGNTWGDPYNAFVGSITGRQNTTGYGVYWGPIERAAKAYRPAQAFTGWSASQLATTLAAGNPVVMWGVYPGGYYDPWYTPGGKYINAWKGEHVRTVIGFYGPVSNPTKFIINDPVSGQITWSTSQFMSDWASFGNSGVVVY